MKVKELSEKIQRFREERGWTENCDERDIAISIAIETGELLEHFQWGNTKVNVEKNFQGIKEELADVLIYSMTLATMLGVDVENIIQEKLEINKKKYPATQENKA